MMFQDQNTQELNRNQANSVTYDEGLRSYFIKIYNTMSLGLVVTALVAFSVANTPALVNMIFGTPLKWVFMFAPLAVVFFGFTPRAIQRRSVGQLKGWFYGFSALLGISMSAIFLVYSGESIARVFFITSAMFAGMSLFGYTTKRSLTGMGSFLMMGVWGILIAMVVNMFLQSTMVHFIVSILGVVIYTGLVAYDTQNLKRGYSGAQGGEITDKMAVMGALSLYINFIMMFQFLMNLLGNR